jgi:hypothetical protein
MARIFEDYNKPSGHYSLEYLWYYFHPQPQKVVILDKTIKLNILIALYNGISTCKGSTYILA